MFDLMFEKMNLNNLCISFMCYLTFTQNISFLPCEAMLGEKIKGVVSV